MRTFNISESAHTLFQTTYDYSLSLYRLKSEFRRLSGYKAIELYSFLNNAVFWEWPRSDSASSECHILVYQISSDITKIFQAKLQYYFEVLQKILQN